MRVQKYPRLSSDSNFDRNSRRCRRILCSRRVGIVKQRLARVITKLLWLALISARRFNNIYQYARVCVCDTWEPYLYFDDLLRLSKMHELTSRHLDQFCYTKTSSTIWNHRLNINNCRRLWEESAQFSALTLFAPRDIGDVGVTMISVFSYYGQTCHW